MAKDAPLPTRRSFLATAAAAGAVSLVPAALKAGESEMAIQDDVRPAPMTTPATSAANLFLLEDIENGRIDALAQGDRDALRAVADWTRSFIVQPHRDLGRAGPVCPFVPVSLEHRTLWLAPEHSAGKSTAEVVALVERYKGQLLAARPLDGIGSDHKSIVVVFTDLRASDAKAFFEPVLQQIGLSSYAEEGLVMGPFYEGNDGTAIYNSGFRPFQSPVPFLLMRRAVVSDWKFFLNNEEWFRHWARRYGETGVDALAAELRRMPWRERP